jgi:transcriptional regulator with XRE-family HTH domain
MQCRMARAALNWTVKDLSDKAQVGISTVVRFEAGRGKPIVATTAAMVRIFEAAGIRFIDKGVCFDGAEAPGKPADAIPPRWL